MRRFQKATISDVAQRAGVSITTVSVFVSGRESVCSPKTAERIRSAISDLHYTPSLLVSSVQGRATTTLGVCMSSPLDPNLTYGNFFYERLWRGVIAQADQEDYSLLHYPVSFRESGRIDAFLDGRVDGVLYHSRAHAAADDRPVRLIQAGMPTVLLTRSHDLPEGCGAAAADEFCTADLGLSHLWERGHRRIAHIAGPIGLGADIALGRLEAYRAWMQERNAYDPVLEAHAGGWHDEHVAEIITFWMSLPVPPTAVFCANDALALSVISVIRAQGGSVPGDLSVIGVDNTAAEAGLTSIEPPNEMIGREAVRALVRLIQGKPLEECRVLVPVTNLMVRESTAAI